MICGRFKALMWPLWLSQEFNWATEKNTHNLNSSTKRCNNTLIEQCSFGPPATATHGRPWKVSFPRTKCFVNGWRVIDLKCHWGSVSHLLLCDSRAIDGTLASFLVGSIGVTVKNKTSVRWSQSAASFQGKLKLSEARSGGCVFRRFWFTWEGSFDKTLCTAPRQSHVCHLL